MAKMIKRTTREARAELQAWYLADLRPRLAGAARRGAVAPGAAAALDVDLRQLLDMTGDRLEEAA